MTDESKEESFNLFNCENQINWEGLDVPGLNDYNVDSVPTVKWDGRSFLTHPLDNLLDIAPYSIKRYYMENPPQLSDDCLLSIPSPPPSQSMIPPSLTQSPRTVPSVSNPCFEVNQTCQKQNNLLASPINLQHFSLIHPVVKNENNNQENGKENQSRPDSPPPLIFCDDKPKKRTLKPSDIINDENNTMIHYYNEIMKNAKKKYKDMSPLSNIDGTEKYVDGIIGMPEEIPQDQIDKFTEYSKLNFICKKCFKTFPLLKACTYFNGGLCCVQCCSCIHRETIGLYDYMKDVYFENEDLYKCDRIIHYRPLWQFLKYEKKKKSWKIAKLCIYCRNLKGWEYLNKPTRRRKTIQQMQNEKAKHQPKQSKQQQQQQNISSVINPDDHLIISQEDEYNNNCCNKYDVVEPAKKKSKKNNKKSKKPRKTKFEDEEDDEEDDNFDMYVEDDEDEDGDYKY